MHASPHALTVTRLTEPSDYPAWDAFVSAAGGSWYHTTAWMRAVQAAFGHEPIYLRAAREDQVVGVLPLFLVRSLLGGRMLVSVPYAVYGGALTADDAATDALRHALANEIRDHRAAVVDLRSTEASFDGLEVNDRYVTFRRELPDRPEDVFGWLPRKARAAARHGRDKFGLRMEFGHHLLPVVWRLYCKSMRRLASLNYPYRFFEALARASPERTLTSLVYFENHPVGGLFTLLHCGTFMPYVAGMDDRFRHACVGNFMYMALMQRAVDMGFRVFDFGRSRVDNVGAFNFKKFHGFEPTPLRYQRYEAAGGASADLTPTSARFRLGRRLWPHLPMAMTRPLGAWLARHIPG